MPAWNLVINILYAEDDHDVLKLMEEIGLTVEKVPFTNYSADLNAVKTLPEGTMDRINHFLEKIELWVIRAKKKELSDRNAMIEKTNSNSQFSKRNPTNVKVENTNGNVEIILSGRLDSLNAPELLDKFLKLDEMQEISHVLIKMEQLEYISSAGIRTLLLIKEKVNDKCSITGYHDSIRDILKKAGLDETFV